MLYGYIASETLTDTTIDQSILTEKRKSMADLDKEEEARMAKLYKENAKKGVSGALSWLEARIKSGGARRS